MPGVSIGVCAAAATYLGARAAMGFGRDVRGAVFDRVLSFSAREVNHFGAPSLITRTTNDVQQLDLLDTEIKATADLPTAKDPVACAAPSITEDDTVEAIEVPGAPHIVAVQWHPELLEDWPEHQGLFRQLVEHAAARARNGV